MLDNCFVICNLLCSNESLCFYKQKNVKWWRRVNVLLSLVSKETDFAFDRPALSWVEKTEQNLGERNQIRQLPWFSSLRETRVKIFPGKLPPCGATQIIRNGLIKMWELSSKILEIMGQAVFKRIQFPCDYFG